MPDDMPVSLRKSEFPGAVLLEYYVWNNKQVHTAKIEDNNLIFLEELYIIKSRTIKDIMVLF